MLPFTANGETINFPMSSQEAYSMGWHPVKHSIMKDEISYDELNNWLKDNVKSRAYWLGPYFVYFYRRADAEWFTLKWL